MNIALIGATGFVGSAVLQELLSRGHQVVALLRDPSKLTATAQLRSVAVDVNQADAVASAVKGADAVVSAYGPGWTTPDFYTAYLQGADAITAGVKQAGVKRFVVVGGAGSLYVAPGAQLVDTPEFPAQWKPAALATREALNRIRTETSLDWAFLSPPAQLEPGERLGRYRVGADDLLTNEQGQSRISAADLAVAIVDELESPRHHQQRFTVAY